MGYQTCLHLVDVKIKVESVSLVRRKLSRRKSSNKDPLRFFFERAVLDSNNFLMFKASDDGLDPYGPFDDGTTPALYGKWYEAERIAEWIKQYVEKGGRMVLHSLEADGAAWGWEFDGRGRMRALALKPSGKWG